MPRVSDLLLAVASQLKIPISSVRDRLQSWLEVHSADVAPVRVSDPHDSLWQFRENPTTHSERIS